MKKVALGSKIFTIENFLSKIECNNYIIMGEFSSFSEAKVSIDGQQVMLKGVRNNKRIMFKDTSLANNIWNKVISFVPELIENYSPIGVNEMFRIYKYEKGERFKMHRDGSFIRNENERSFYSFLIYLNDDFKGGETNFKQGISVTPKCGNALIFHHPLKHEGKQIISGIKYVLRTDIMYKKIN